MTAGACIEAVRSCSDSTSVAPRSRRPCADPTGARLGSTRWIRCPETGASGRAARAASAAARDSGQRSGVRVRGDRRRRHPPSASRARTGIALAPTIAGVGRRRSRPGAGDRLPGRRRPAGDRRQGRGARPRPSRARWSAAIPASTSTSAPDSPWRSSPAARCSTGRHGASGEIGYNLRSVADVGPAADRPHAAGGCRQRAGASCGAARRVRRRGERGGGVFGSAHRSPRWPSVVSDFVAELSFHLVNLAIAVDPARIVVGGGMVRSWA